MRRILCILAGGESRRFNGSKLDIRIANEPIIAYTKRRLTGTRSSSWETWLSLGPNQALPAGAGLFQRIIRDFVSFRGPLPGMLCAMNQVAGAGRAPERLYMTNAPANTASAEIVFVPADMPTVQRRTVEAMLESLSKDKELAGVCGKSTLGRRAGSIEPFPSAWRVARALPLLQRAIAGGLYSPSQLGRWPGVATIAIEKSARFVSNINTRDDLTAIQAQLGGKVSAPPASSKSSD